MWVEGWSPAWPDATWVVWAHTDGRAGGRAPIYVHGALKLPGQPEAFMDVVHAERLRLGAPSGTVGYGPPHPEHDVWVREYWRAGLTIGACPIPSPLARAARISRELARTATDRDGGRVPGLVFHRRAVDVHTALGEASGIPDAGPVAALGYAVAALPEPVARRPEDPVELARDVFGRVAFPAGSRPRPDPGEGDGGLYGDPDW